MKRKRRLKPRSTCDYAESHFLDANRSRPIVGRQRHADGGSVTYEVVASMHNTMLRPTKST